MGMLQTPENILATSYANCLLIGRYIMKPFEHIMLKGISRMRERQRILILKD